jgi:hypothetical protein
MNKKRLFILIMFFSTLLLHADPPQLTWRIANPRIIKVTQQRLEFEVQVKADQNGTYYSSGQFLLYFNNDAISYSSDLHWTVIPSGISAQTHANIGNKYIISRVRSGAYPNVKVLVGLSPTDEAVIDEDPAAGYLTEITTGWQTYVKIQCNIADFSALAGIYFYREGTNGQNFYLSSPGNEAGYNNPSLYQTLDLSQAYLGRLYSTMYGWTQYGGATDNVPYLDWTTAVNTSAWEGTPNIDGSDYQMDALRIHEGVILTIQSGASLTVGNPEADPQGILLIK